MIGCLATSAVKHTGIAVIDETRTARIDARIKPSIKAAIEADRKAKGQPLVEWLERAAQTVLAISENKEQASGE